MKRSTLAIVTLLTALSTATIAPAFADGDSSDQAPASAGDSSTPASTDDSTAPKSDIRR